MAEGLTFDRFSPIIPAGERGEPVPETKRFVDYMFANQEAPWKNLMLESKRENQITRAALEERASTWLSDVLWHATPPPRTWETEIFTDHIVDRLHFQFREATIHSTILTPTPEAAPMRGVPWSSQSKEIKLDRYAIHCRATVEQMDLERGVSIFLGLLNEMQYADERLVKLNEQYAVLDTPNFIGEAIARRGGQGFETYESARDRKWRSFGQLDKNEGLQDLHWDLQAIASQAGLGSTAFYDGAVICGSSMKKTAHSSAIREYSHSGEGTKILSNSPLVVARDLVNGLAVYEYLPEVIDTQKSKIDMFAMINTVGCWSMIQAQEGSIRQLNAATDSMEEIFIHDAIDHFLEFGPDGTISQDFYDFAKDYKSQCNLFGWNPMSSHDPLIFVDERGVAHVAETFGETDPKFYDDHCADTIGKFFASHIGKDKALMLDDLFSWAAKLHNPLAAPNEVLTSIFDYVTRAGASKNTWGGIIPPRFKTDDPNVLIDPSTKNEAGRIDLEEGTTFQRLPYGFSMVSELFAIRDALDDYGPLNYEAEFEIAITNGVPVLEELERLKRKVFGENKLFDNFLFERYDGLDATKSKTFASLHLSLEKYPKRRVWRNAREVRESRVPRFSTSFDALNDELGAEVVSGIWVSTFGKNYEDILRARGGVMPISPTSIDTFITSESNGDADLFAALTAYVVDRIEKQNARINLKMALLVLTEAAIATAKATAIATPNVEDRNPLRYDSKDKTCLSLAPGIVAKLEGASLTSATHPLSIEGARGAVTPEARFDLYFGEEETEVPESLGMFEWMVFVRAPLFLTKDEQPAIKKHLLDRLKKYHDYDESYPERYGRIQLYFTEIRIAIVKDMLKMGFPSPLGNVFLACPFGKLKMRAAVWFRHDKSTGVSLATKPHLYPAQSPHSQDFIVIFTGWRASQVLKHKNINVVPNASYGSYIEGLDHEWINKEKWEAWQGDSGKYRGSMLPVNVGCKFTRNSARKLYEISLLGTHAFDYRGYQFRGESLRKYKPRDGPYLPGAMYLNYMLEFRSHHDEQQQYDPNATFNDVKGGSTEYLLVMPQRHMTRSSLSSTYDIVYPAAAPFPDRDAPLVKDLFNNFNEISPRF